jgi:hypothetical protein
MTEPLWRQDMSTFGVPPSIGSAYARPIKPSAPVCKGGVRLDTRRPRFFLTVSLTATFSPLAGVGFRFPRIPGMSFKLLKRDVLGNYCFIRLSDRIAFNVSDLRRCYVLLPHTSPHSNSGRPRWDRKSYRRQGRIWKSPIILAIVARRALSVSACNENRPLNVPNLIDPFNENHASAGRGPGGRVAKAVWL